MKKPIRFIIFMLISTFQLNAQIKHEVVYLNNGSIIHGKIINDSSETLTLKTLDGNTLVFSYNDIKMTESRLTRFINHTSAGFIMGSAINEKSTVLSVITENGFLINEYLSAGIVSGVELINETTIPVGLNMKSYYNFGSNVIFLNASMGKSIPVDKPFFEDIYAEPLHTYGGIFTTIEFGYSIPFNYRNALFFGIGYRYNRLNYDYDNWGYGVVDRQYIYHRLSMRLGVIIN